MNTTIARTNVLLTHLATISWQNRTRHHASAYKSVCRQVRHLLLHIQSAAAVLTFAAWLCPCPLLVPLATSDAVSDEHVAIGALVRYQRIVRGGSIHSPAVVRVFRNFALDCCNDNRVRPIILENSMQ